MSIQVPQILDSEGVPCGMCVIKTKNKNDKSELPPGTFCSCVCIVCMRERDTLKQLFRTLHQDKRCLEFVSECELGVALAVAFVDV